MQKQVIISKNHKKQPRTSLVVQWFRICLPMQERRVQSLVREPRSHVLQGS